MNYSQELQSLINLSKRKNLILSYILQSFIEKPFIILIVYPKEKT